LDLPKLANPLRDVVVFDPAKLSYPDPHRAALRSMGHLHGWRGIVQSFPASQRTGVEQGLIKAKAVWWKPLEIWEHWSECLKKTLPSIFEPGLHSSAAAYWQALTGDLSCEPSLGASKQAVHLPGNLGFEAQDGG
jgi:hypothetical protein